SNFGFPSEGGAMPPVMFVVDRREAGQTLAAVLKRRFGLSWSQAKRLVERGHVRVGQQVETDVAPRLKVGKRVQLAAGTVQAPNAGTGPRSAKPKPKAPVSREAKTSAGDHRKRPPQPALTGIDIVYSDDAVVVVNKPAGLTTMRHAEEAAEFG